LSTAPPSSASVLAKPSEGRFYELDILRGLAAFLVVIFHYKHFLYKDMGVFEYAHMPFKPLLMPVFIYGQYFVELFFTISGYVFFWLYSEAIAERRNDAKAFFIARFSRLYPLYFVTFIAVALIQALFRALYGYDFIYEHNSLVNFALNLFMVHQWVPHPELSFNGPSWSISVEVFLYTLFFGLCFFRLNKLLPLLGLVGIGLVVRLCQIEPINDFSRGIPSFFLGGLVFYAVRSLKAEGYAIWRQRVALALTFVVPALWLFLYIRTQLAPGVTQAALVAAADATAAPPEVDLTLSDYLFSNTSFIYVLMPLTLLWLGLKQGQWGVRWLDNTHLHRLSWIGDISYSLYLIHFPLQLALMLIMAHWPLETRAPILGSSVVFVVFMTLASGLAWLSYTYFERPAQRFLRGWLSARLRLTAPII
jgi:peptidoglycan/LPS O-acetylase OafA/YrhL